MIIEQHIEELRAELRNAVYKDEREWILKELASAERQLAADEATYDTAVLTAPSE
jgi:hypothetical protein